MQRSDNDHSTTITWSRDAGESLAAYEITGPASAPVVVVLGGISAGRRVTGPQDDRPRGWWSEVVGTDRAVDTARLRVLGLDYLDGGCGADGRPARIVTTHDQADALAEVLRTLGIDSVLAIVGSSYGGMVALAFAERYPTLCERLVVISAAHQPHPMTTALRSIQRGIVELGLDTNRATAALSLARGLAMTTYRSSREFADRFNCAPEAVEAGQASFPVESYLRHHGDTFAATWRPERFLALSLSCDLHRIDPRAIRTPTTLVAAEDDAIVPRAQIVTLAAALAGPVELIDLPTPYGHDAFLAESDRIGSIVSSAITTSTLS